MTPSNATTSTDKRQFIAFHSGDQEFGADIMMIREIRGWTPTTSLPDAPPHVRGVTNLRGTVLPVVDLKAQLGRGATDVSAKHVIIVVRNGDQTLGLLVDAVSDILTVADSEIQPTPDLARAGDSEFVAGIAVLDARMVTILNLDRLTSALANLDKAA